MQRGRTGTEADRISRSHVRRKFFFELVDLRPGRQPVRLQNFNHRPDIGIIQTLPPVRQQFFAHRCAAIDGQRFDFCEWDTHAGSLSSSICRDGACPVSLCGGRRGKPRLYIEFQCPATPKPEAPQAWSPALPVLPVLSASASAHCCRSNNESLLEAAWHSPSFPTSTTDAPAESRTY